MAKTYTTGEIAKVCRCSQSTVVRWLNTGLLKYYKVPNSQVRRVTTSDLYAFLVEHNVETAYDSSNKQILTQARDKVLTTGEASKLCKVSHNTIIRWADAGLLKVYYLPGSNNRRILIPQLIKFITERLNNAERQQKVTARKLRGLESEVLELVAVQKTLYERLE